MLSRLANFFWPTTTRSTQPKALAATPLTDELKAALKSEDSIPDSGTPPVDNLQVEMDRLDKLNTTFLQDIKAWEKLRDDLLATDKLAENAEISLQPVMSVAHRSLLASLKEMLKGLLESPDLYLREHLLPSCEEVQKLAKHLDDLLKIVDSEPSPAAKRAVEVDICNTSLGILTQFKDMIDTTQGEINYCLGVESIGENILKGAIYFAIGQVPYGILKVDLELEAVTRAMLYKSIRNEVDHLCTFMTQVDNAVNDAKRICTPASLSSVAALRTSGTFARPVTPPVVNDTSVTESKGSVFGP